MVPHTAVLAGIFFPPRPLSLLHHTLLLALLASGI